MKAIKTILATLATALAAVPSIDCLASDSHKQSIVSNYNRNDEKNMSIVNDLRKKTDFVRELAGMAGRLYLELLSMSTEDARDVVRDSGISSYENSEMFIRALEIFAKNTVEENVSNEVVHGEIVKYWKSVAKARYEISRLNGFVKQLTFSPKVFESEISFNALRDLSNHTTNKIISGEYGSI